MLNVEYRLKLGQDEFVLKAEVKDEKEFFEQMSFYSNLPRTAPGGSTDLKLVFRKTKKGHKYYSLISDKEKMEFKLGQNLDANGGGLFPKGWEPAYQEGADEDGPSQQGAPIIGGQQTAPQQAPVQQAPIIGSAPALPNPNFPGLTNPIIGPSAATSAPTPVAMPSPVAPPIAPVQMPAQTAPAAPAPAAMPAQAANPNVAAVANNVLARFGIQK